jgi:hypothetical protein
MRKLLLVSAIFLYVSSSAWGLSYYFRGFSRYADLNASYSGTQNYSRLKKALDLCLAEGTNLVLPPGTFTITMSSVADTLRISSSITISGAGKYLTVLNFGPVNPSFYYSGFVIRGGYSADVVFKDFTINGPATNTTDKAYAGINHTGSALTGTYSGSVICENMVVKGAWTVGVNENQGTDTESESYWYIEFRNCDLIGGANNDKTLVNVYAGNTHKKLHVYNCFVQITDADASHMFYVHNRIPVHFEGNRFDGSNSIASTGAHYAVQHYGGAAPVDTIFYERYINNEFRNCPSGVLTSYYGKAIFRNNDFYHVASKCIEARNPVDINGGYVNCPGASFFSDYAGASPRTDIIRMYGVRIDSAGIALSLVENGSEGVINKIYLDNMFWGRGVTWPILIGGDSTIVYGSNLQFDIKDGITAAVKIIAGKEIHFDNCKSTGGSATCLLVEQAIGFMEVNNFDFGNEGYAIKLDSPVASGTVFGRGNNFRKSQIYTLTGGKYFLIQPRTMYEPTAVASTASPVFGTSANTFKVSGTTPIDNILIGGTTRAFCGVYNFIATDGDVPMTISGNIAVVDTLVQKRMKSMIYLPDLNKWYPSDVGHM